MGYGFERQLVVNVECANAFDEVPIQFDPKGEFMGKTKEVDDPTSNANLSGLKNKVSPLKAVNFKEFHEKIGIEILS